PMTVSTPLSLHDALPIYFGQNLVVLETLVTLEHDAVDYRVLDHGYDHVAVVVGDGVVGEQLGRGEVLQRLVGKRRGIDLPGAHLDIADYGRGFEPLGASDGDLTDDLALLSGGRGGCGRWRRGRLRRHIVLSESHHRDARQNSASH